LVSRLGVAALCFAAILLIPQRIALCATTTGPAAHLSSALFEITVSNNFIDPDQVAVDAAGNLYVADDLANAVYKLTRTGGTGGTWVQTVVADMGLNQPYGVAVDSKGNVYIADTDNSRVLLETVHPSGAYTQTVVPTSGLGAFVYQLAVDSKGNIYITDLFNNRVVEEVASTTGYTQVTIPATGLSSPQGVAVDKYGDVFIADTGNSRVVKETPSGGTYTQTLVADSWVNTPNGVNTPTGLALLGTTLFIADSFNNRIVKEAYNSTTKVYTQTTVTTGTLNTPAGVAVDANGDVFIGDTHNKRVVEDFQGLNTNFGPWPIATTSSAATLTFKFDQGGAIGAPLVETSNPGASVFTNAGTGTCIKGTTFATGATCTIEVTFKPAIPGFIYGLAELRDSSGNELAEAEITGTGVGGQLFYPGSVSESNVTVNESSAQGVAEDSTGNFFIADTGNDRVLKETKSAGTYTQSIIVSGLKGPTWIAVDEAGNVFVNDAGNKRVLEETPPATGTVWTQTVVYGEAVSSTDTTAPGPIAVDRDGNLYIVLSNHVAEYQLVAGAWKQTNELDIYTPAAAGVTPKPITPVSLAVDAAGNFFVGEPTDNALSLTERVVRYTSIGSGYAQTVVESGVYPQGLAVDHIGNVWMTSSNGDLYIHSAAESAGSHAGNVAPLAYSQNKLPTGSALFDADQLAVDANGDVFIADGGHSRVVKENYTRFPSLNFPNQVVGTTSDPQTKSMLNVGNAPVSFTIPSTGQNPAISLASYALESGETSACPTLSSSASEPGSLDVGALCDVGVTFTPAAVVAYNGTLVYQTNLFNTKKVTISLYGDGIATIPDITWNTPASIAYGTPLSATQLNATASYNGQTVPGTFVYSPGLGTVPHGGTRTLSVTFTPTSASYSPATATVQIQVTPVPLDIVADSFTRAYGAANPTFTASYVGFVNGDTPGDTNGYFTMATEATSGFPWGYYAITLTVVDPFVTPDYTVQYFNGTLVITQATLTVTASNATMVAGAALPTFTYTATGFVNGDTAAVLSGAPLETTTATSSSPAGAYMINIGPGTLSALNYNFAFVTGTLTITAAAKPPAFSLAEGTYASTLAVALTDATPGAAIHYTVNGAAPTAASPKYTGPIEVSKTETIRAIAVVAGLKESPIASASYTIR